MMRRGLDQDAQLAPDPDCARLPIAGRHPAVHTDAPATPLRTWLPQVDLGPLRLTMISGGPGGAYPHCSMDQASGLMTSFVFQECGTARMQQNSGSIELSAGQWAGFQTDRPFLISACETSRQLLISLPSRILGDPRMTLEPWFKARSFRSGAARIFYCAVAAAAISPPPLGEADLRRVGAGLVNLLQVALRERNIPDSFRRIDMRRERALQFIGSNLKNRELGVGMIADALGCSSRMVHKLFQDSGLTVGRQILAMRLDRCHAELSHPDPARHSIEEIACTWGFVSPQHFRRAFKERFGILPRDLRDAAVARFALATEPLG